MAILRLNIEDEDTLELIGIQSSWPEHRLVWTLNKELEVLLERSEDYILETSLEASEQGLFSSEDKKEFSVFEYESDFERMVLVSNLSQGMALYDKGRPFDYLLRIDSSQRSLRDCSDLISEMKGILAVGRIDCGPGERASKPFNALD